MFVEKTQAEIDAMTPEQVDAYKVALKAHQAQELQAKIDAAVASKADATLVTELKSELSRVSGELAALKETPKPQEVGYKTIGEALRAEFAKKADEINKVVANGGRQEAPITVKVAVVMGEGNTIGAGATQVSLTDDTGIISPIRKRELTYLSEVSVGRIGNERALWIEELDEQGNPVFIGENDEKTKLSVRYEEQTASVKKIAVYGKVTTEMMADLPQLISYIEMNLMKRLDIALENGYFNGNNIGDQLNGAFNFATAFSAGVLANTIDFPNDYDVVRAVALQCQLAFGIPSAIFVNPAIVARMQLTKDQDGQYVMPTFTTANGIQVAGMKVVATTAVTGENFIGGDMRNIQVRVREDLGIQIGLDGNDFTHNRKTMLVERRVVQFCSANDTPTIIKGTFATAKAALATT